MGWDWSVWKAHTAVSGPSIYDNNYERAFYRYPVFQLLEFLGTSQYFFLNELFSAVVPYLWNLWLWNNRIAPSFVPFTRQQKTTYSSLLIVIVALNIWFAC